MCFFTHDNECPLCDSSSAHLFGFSVQVDWRRDTHLRTRVTATRHAIVLKKTYTLSKWVVSSQTQVLSLLVDGTSRTRSS